MNQLIDKLFELGKAKGFEDQEVYYSSSQSTVIGVFRGEVEKSEFSRSGGLSYRGILGGRLGYSYTECVDESSLEMLVEEAYSNAGAIESEDRVFIFGEKRDYAAIDSFDPELARIPIEEKIALPMRLDRRIRELEPRVTDVMHCTYEEIEGEMRIRNTRGLDLSNRSNYCEFFAVGMLRDAEENHTAIGGKVANRFRELDAEQVAQSIVEQLRARVGAASMKSGAHKVLFERSAFASLFGVFTGHFSADQAQKDLSAFKGKIGEAVASPALTLADDPHLENGVASHAFDAEGYPTSRKLLIENGVLRTLLHNLKTAYKEGIESTGNASKAGFKGSIGISESNLVFGTGSKSFDELIAAVGDGVLITELAGLHSGVNGMSGDFSLMADGFRIRGGAKAEPLKQITVSGNFFEMLRDIEEMGADRDNSVQNASIYAPSVVVRSLAVAGEEKTKAD